MRESERMRQNKVKDRKREERVRKREERETVDAYMEGFVEAALGLQHISQYE